MKVRTTIRLAAALTSLLLLAAACGSSDEPAAADSEGRTPGSTPVEEPSETPHSKPSGTVPLEVWFASGEWLYPAHRTVPKTQAVGRAAIEALLDAPDDTESGLEIATVIPEGVELLGLDIDDGVATVDLSGEYEEGGGSLMMRMRLAQVVYTLTQFPTVKGVLFMIDGEPIETFSGEGIMVDEPQRRRDFKDLLPPIVVESPAIGEAVSSPVMISGNADVFEATVSIRILDAGGNVLIETFTTATCGTGCRGDYSEDVAFEVDEDQQGTIVVFESSAEDGSELFPVKIPVTLTP